MPSTCPKCHEIVAEDLICCADLTHVWKCLECNKVCSGFAMPYGRCFLCGGTLRPMDGLKFEDPMRVAPIRDAVQFELNSYHFYRLALSKTQNPTQRTILEGLYHHEVDHLRTLQERYHTHLDEEVLNLRPDADALLRDRLFQGIDLTDPRSGPLGIYDRAIEMERRTRDHFRRLSSALPPGPEKDVCLELAAEEEEHVAILETERARFIVTPGEPPRAGRDRRRTT